MRKPIERMRKPRKAAAKKEERAKYVAPFKLFGRWDSTGIEVKDPGLKPYINLEPRLLPRSAGKLRRPFHKSKAHIVERLALHVMVPGHQGKKHKVTSGPKGGHLYRALDAVEKALELVEKAENKNPIEILVRAIENSSVREEIISYQIGSVVAREAVITAPQRRIDKTLRLFAQGSYRSSFNKNSSIAQALANEILAAYRGKDSFTLKEKERIEREASGAR
jgi:small subunit ribosomal protein S7